MTDDACVEPQTLDLDGLAGGAKPLSQRQGVMDGDATILYHEIPTT